MTIHLQYGTFQIVCDVADPADPTIAVVRDLQCDYPNVDLEVVIDPRIHGANHARPIGFSILPHRGCGKGDYAHRACGSRTPLI